MTSVTKPTIRIKQSDLYCLIEWLIDTEDTPGPSVCINTRAFLVRTLSPDAEWVILETILCLQGCHESVAVLNSFREHCKRMDWIVENSINYRQVDCLARWMESEASYEQTECPSVNFSTKTFWCVASINGW
jgi:hypothetical protein